MSHYNTNDLQAGSVSILSMISASISIAQIQSVVSLLASAVALISGYYSAKYFIKQNKK